MAASKLKIKPLEMGKPGLAHVPRNSEHPHSKNHLDQSGFTIKFHAPSFYCESCRRSAKVELSFVYLLCLFNLIKVLVQNTHRQWYKHSTSNRASKQRFQRPGLADWVQSVKIAKTLSVKEKVSDDLMSLWNSVVYGSRKELQNRDFQRTKVPNIYRRNLVSVLTRSRDVKLLLVIPIKSKQIKK